MKAELKDLEVIYHNENFTITKYDYGIQYYPYYKSRLQKMRITLMKSACKTWPDIPIHEITDLAERSTNDDDNDSNDTDSQSSQTSNVEFHGKEVVIIGSLFKKMPKQPNILKELDDEKKLASDIELEPLKNFISDNDLIYLQSNDESIELRGAINIGCLCTGLCVAVKGYVNPNGSGFIVNDILFSTVDQIQRPLLEADQYLALASGLGFSKNMSKNQSLVNSLNLLFDVLTGNSELYIKRMLETKRWVRKGKVPAWNKKVQSYTHDAVKLMDKFLANVGQYMHVDFMPGPIDPCSILLPQQPLHPCMFPKSYPLGSIRSVTNPHHFSIGGVRFLGTSGQNIDSLRSCTSFTESTDIMRQLMEWGHIAPTCPDLLHCYPFADKDPFVVDQYPDVFFAGNQPDFSLGTFESSEGKKVKLVSIPVFEDKMILVLINLRTLNLEMVALD
ncbi:DNA polymerase delta subunit 2 [Blomia tropicalis]|nr:DNA polymerase delta subunit 2 [Blomia tropicalis]